MSVQHVSLAAGLDHIRSLVANTQCTADTTLFLPSSCQVFHNLADVLGSPTRIYQHTVAEEALPKRRRLSADTPGPYLKLRQTETS